MTTKIFKLLQDGVGERWRNSKNNLATDASEGKIIVYGTDFYWTML